VCVCVCVCVRVCVRVCKTQQVFNGLDLNINSPHGRWVMSHCWWCEGVVECVCVCLCVCVCVCGVKLFPWENV